MRPPSRTRRSFGSCLLLTSALGPGALPALEAADASRIITIFQGRRITVRVPPGWTASDMMDRRTGVQTLMVADPRNEVELQASFFPNTTRDFGDRAVLDAAMNQAFGLFIAGSVERELKIVRLARGDGACARFTDSSLVNRKPAPGQWPCATVGLRHWQGAFLTFTLLSFSYEGRAYATAFELATRGIREVGTA